MAPRPLGVYIHWPFCESKCPYCDFNSHVRETIDQTRWQAAYLAELACYAKMLEHSEYRLQSLFFGGGTPSLMAPETVAEIISKAKKIWPVSDDLEITLEANPGSVDAAKFAAFAQAGVNRLSMGIQALDDEALRFLGRRHSRAEALDAAQTARRHFPRCSFDLIYARPGQSRDQWRAELTEALEILGADHLSLYQLTIEEGTAFYTDWRAGRLRVPENDHAAALYEMTDEVCAANGMHSYEISNYARPGQGCRHNLVYWRYQDYIGIGPGAHGRLSVGPDKLGTYGHRLPETWLDKVEAHGHGRHAAREETITPDARPIEVLLMGLRLSEGVPLARLETESGGRQWQEIISAEKRAALEGEGYLCDKDPQILRATTPGRLRLNLLIETLLTLGIQ